MLAISKGADLIKLVRGG